MKIAIAQIAPVLLDRVATTGKVVAAVREAAGAGCGVVAFGEALVPGYPVWLSRTGGSRFDDADQKALHALYAEQAVVVERGDLDAVVAEAKRGGIMVVLGVVERPRDRGGHSLYCSCIVIDPVCGIVSCHRKLMPTYEERLCWGIGDGHGLVTHSVGVFTLGALNCWENWMPLARAALHAQGENLHVALWPGRAVNTTDITRFMARESRSYVLSASGTLHERDVPAGVPLRERILRGLGEPLAHEGGSCIAGPDGEWIVEPVIDAEGLVMSEIDIARVHKERQNFDPSGHYSRPDVLQLVVQRERQGVARFVGDMPEKSGMKGA